MGKLVKATVTDETGERLEREAKRTGLGLNHVVRSILELWAQGKAKQEKRDKEEGSVYGP